MTAAIPTFGDGLVCCAPADLLLDVSPGYGAVGDFGR
jgi:hypothetical protein